MPDVEWAKPEHLKLLWVCLFFFALWCANLFSRLLCRPLRTFSSKFSFFGETKPQLLLIFILAGFALALSRPQTASLSLKRNNFDIVMLVDSTLSMKANDIAGGRFERAKKEIGRIIKNFVGEGDRIALLRFGNGIGVESYLTSEGGEIFFKLRNLEIDVNDADNWNTDYAFALESAFDVVDWQRKYDIENKKIPKDRRVVFLIFSDGDDVLIDDKNSNYEQTLAKPLSRYKEFGWRIYAVGVGTRTGAEVVAEINGESDSSESGSEKLRISTKLRDEELRYIADFTGGEYFAISRSSVSADDFYGGIFERERVAGATETMKTRTEFYWQILAGCGGLLFLVLLAF